MSSLADELQRAAARESATDGFYRGISDRLTGIAQRLFPVWVICAPGVADPAHIEPRGGTVYLESVELLGPDEELRAHTASERAIMRTLGALFHEVFHRVGSRVWIIERAFDLTRSEDADERKLGQAMLLLEEPRMEAVVLRDYDPSSTRGGFLRRAINAVVVDVILKRALDVSVREVRASGAIRRSMAGRWAVYLRARTFYGVMDPASLGPMSALIEDALGADDLMRLDDLLQRVITIPHGDWDALEAAARSYLAIIGDDETDEDEQDAGGQTDGDAQSDDGSASSDSNAGGDGGASDANSGGSGAEAAADALREAVEAVTEEEAEAAQEAYPDDQEVQRAAREVNGATGSSEQGRVSYGQGAGAGSGRLPDLGVDRPPVSRERAAAQRLASRLREAMVTSPNHLRRKRPGGKFRPRQYMKAQAQRALGQRITAEPYRVSLPQTAPIREPHILVVVDTSYSMNTYEYALGPVVWMLTEGFREFGGRLATMLFGAQAAVLADGTKAMPKVPGVRTGGGTMHADKALRIGADLLGLGTDPGRPDAVYIISDGDWYDTEDGLAAIGELRNAGVPILHVSIGRPPMGVEADRVTVIDDPADAMDVIARDTVDVLTGRFRVQR